MSSSATRPAGGSARKSRNDSPAPKGAAKAGAKSPEELRKAAEAATAAAAAAAAQKKEEESYIFGFHPEAAKVLILGPLAVAAVVLSTLFFDVGKKVVVFVRGHWAHFSGPAGKLLAKHSDSLVALAALAAFAPLGLAMLVTVFRATMDLHNFPWWQQALLGLLVAVACATAWSVEGTLWTFAAIKSQWDKISDPIEEILATKSDSILLGAAVLCLAPILAAVVAYALRAVWNCRVKIVVEDVTDKK